MSQLLVKLPTSTCKVAPVQAELALMRELAAGNEAAMEQLIRQYGDSVSRLIGRLTGWSEESDDIFQEVLIAAWNKAHRYQGTGSLEGWLKRIAINQCRNQHRKHKVFLRLISSAAQWINLNHETTQSSDKLDGLSEAMTRLKSADREVLALFYLEGLSGDEVADLLGIKPETLHVRLHRARARLKEVLIDTRKSQ